MTQVMHQYFPIPIAEGRYALWMPTNAEIVGVTVPLKSYADTGGSVMLHVLVRQEPSSTRFFRVLTPYLDVRLEPLEALIPLGALVTRPQLYNLTTGKFEDSGEERFVSVYESIIQPEENELDEPSDHYVSS